MFKDRKQAGELLAMKLSKYRDNPQVVILGIPRGGVETAFYLASALKAPLDVIIIKKIGYPGNEELAIGAATIDNFELDKELAKNVSKEYIEKEVQEKQQQAKERYAFLNKNKPVLSLKNKIVIVADDGMATGATMMMAVKVIHQQQPKKVIVAVPVASLEAVNKLQKLAEVICLEQPMFFMAIGQFYEQFEPVEDEEVKKLLEKAERWNN